MEPSAPHLTPKFPREDAAGTTIGDRRDLHYSAISGLRVVTGCALLAVAFVPLLLLGCEVHGTFASVPSFVPSRFHLSAFEKLDHTRQVYVVHDTVANQCVLIVESYPSLERVGLALAPWPCTPAEAPR